VISAKEFLYPVPPFLATAFKEFYDAFDSVMTTKMRRGEKPMERRTEAVQELEPLFSE